MQSKCLFSKPKTFLGCSNDDQKMISALAQEIEKERARTRTPFNL